MAVVMILLPRIRVQQKEALPMPFPRLSRIPFVLFLLFELLVSWIARADGTPFHSGTLSGVIREALTQKPIPNARVMCAERRAVANTEGEFLFDMLTPGVYDVQIEAEGYAPNVSRNVVVSSGRVARVEIELQRSEEKVATLESIRVEASPFRRSSRAATSSTRMNRLEMQRTVGAAWDIQRVFSARLGATTSSDMTNNLVVRGGSPVENGTYMDHIEVPNISHFAGQGETGGGIGMVNLDFVREADFFTGGFPALYGGRLSSILDIRLREGNRERLGGEVELSMAGLGGGFEGPLPNGSWVASYRKSYLDLIQEPLRLTAIPHYDDAHAKVVLDVSPKHRVSLVGIGGRSDVSIPWIRDFEEAALDEWKYAVGATWQAQLRESAVMRWTLSQVENRHDSVAYQDTKEKPVYQGFSKERDTTLEGVLDWGTGVGNALQIGGRIRRSRFRYVIDSEAWHGFSENAGRVIFIKEQTLDARKSAWHGAGYIHWDAVSVGRLTLKLGARAQHNGFTNATSLDPRVGIVWAIARATSLNLSGGLYHQSPTVTELTLDERNLHLDDAEAWHAVAGLERQLGGSARFLVEAYRKSYRRLPVREDARIVASNQSISVGRKEVRGVDFLLEKRLKRGVFGALSLSLSDAKARAARGGWYPDDFDYRTIFTATGGVPLLAGWEFSGKWHFVGGRPYTKLPIRPKSEGGYRLDPDFEERNAVRYPDYHRLDLRLDRRLDFGGWGASLFVEVQNVYDRANVYAWQFDPREGKLLEVYQFKRLVVLGIVADF